MVKNREIGTYILVSVSVKDSRAVILNFVRLEASLVIFEAPLKNASS